MTSELAAQSAPIFQLANRYLDSRHWVRGQKSKAGAPSDKFIHIGVGHALSNWEHVEAAASLLFSHFDQSNSIAAHRAYGTISGARAEKRRCDKRRTPSFHYAETLTKSKERYTRK